MQLYALNAEKKLVFAEDASREEDYYCPECSGKIRPRGGDVRRSHFYHPSGSACHQSSKSIEHLQVQYFLKENLFGTVLLEKRFPEINRIADVVWESEKLIFEVQCSPITAKEVLSRNRDYRKSGYQVVWVFHEKNFNRNRLTAAEHCVLAQPHYYTDINAEGSGMIYDQICKGRRPSCAEKIPLKFELRRARLKGIRAKWLCHLEGTLEVEFEKTKSRENPFKRLCRTLFQMLLESACR